MATSKSKRTGAKRDPRKVMRKSCIGLVIGWEDKSPMSDSQDIVAGEVTHRNPMMAPLAREMWYRLGEWVTHTQPFQWLVKIDVVFRYPNGRDQIETRELKARCVFCLLNEFALDEIQDAMRHGSEEHYLTTRFRVELLGA